MLRIRKAAARGHADHGWLNTYHAFSFANYYDPQHMGFRDLRVINEDRVQRGMGFPTHPHRDMEIISYVLEGALQHKDSIGNGSVIRPGEVQRMSAGTGITHSEFNYSEEDQVHFLQIWIQPDGDGFVPGYEQKTFSNEEKRGVLRLIASRDGRDRSVTINQDVNLFASMLGSDEQITHVIPAGRHVWLQVVRGSVLANGHQLDVSDGAAVSNEERLVVSAQEEAEMLLFDLA